MFSYRTKFDKFSSLCGLLDIRGEVRKRICGVSACIDRRFDEIGGVLYMRINPVLFAVVGLLSQYF